MAAEVLGDVLSNLDKHPLYALMYVPAGEDAVSAQTPVLLVELEDGPPDPERWCYFLEVYTAKDVIEVWSEWRDGRTPRLEDLVQAVAYYAKRDAYLPTDDDR